jgi:hypothetical protein
LDTGTLVADGASVEQTDAYETEWVRAFNALKNRNAHVTAALVQLTGDGQGMLQQAETADDCGHFPGVATNRWRHCGLSDLNNE